MSTAVHSSKKGLKVHGEAWTEMVGVRLDQVLQTEISSRVGAPVTELQPS